MDSAIKWLKASYIAGAVSDGFTSMLMLIPSRMGEIEFRYPMGLGASLMFGWTVLLLWAYQKPVERKGVLVLTIFPVITGLLASAIWAVAAGFFPVQQVVPGLVLGSSLIILMSFSYWKAVLAENKK